MKKNEIAIVFGKFNPAHIGHLALYNHLKDYAEKEGIDHRVYTGTSHFINAKAKTPKINPKTPLNPETKLKHLKRVLGTENVHIHSNPFGAVEDLLNTGHQRVHIVLGSDRIDDDTAEKLQKQFGERVSIVPGPKRSDDVSDRVTSASSTRLRQHAANNDYENFKRYVPDYMSDEHVREYFDDVRHGLRGAKQEVKEKYNPIISSFISNYITEAIKAEKPKRQPLTGEKKLKRRNDNRTNQRNKRTKDDNAIGAGDIRGKVLGVKDDKGHFLIISKRSYNPNKHTKVVDPERASRGALEKFLNNDKFVNTETSQKLFGFKERQKGGGGRKKGKEEEEPKKKSSKKSEEKETKSRTSAESQTASGQDEPGPFDIVPGTIRPKKTQSKNCTIPTSHDAKIVEPAMAAFANAANGIDFKKQVEMGLLDKGTMTAILHSPHMSLHESAQRMAAALIKQFGPGVYFKVVGSKLDDVRLNKTAIEGGLVNTTSKADIHVISSKDNKLVSRCSVKCGASQASSGNWQDSTVGLKWTLDNAAKFGISLSKDSIKEVESIIDFISDPNQYAGNEVTSRGPTGLYKERGEFAGQDPTFTKKEKANKTLTDKLNKLFSKSPDLLALYTYAQMTGIHKFEENSPALADSMIAVSHDGTQVKIAPIDLELAKKLQITIASRIKSGSAATKDQELEWDRLQEQSKKSGKPLKDSDDFRPYAYRNTIRVTICEVDLKNLKESRTPLIEMNGISILKMLTETNKSKKNTKYYNVGTSPEEVKQNLKDLKEISKEDPMTFLSVLNSAFDYEDISPLVDFLDIIPNEGYTVNRIYVNGNEFRIPVLIPHDYPIPGMEVPTVSIEEQNLFERNYRKEYDNYHSRPEQRKNRSKRVLARRLMQKLGKVRKGDGKDVDHKDGNPQNNGRSNLRVRDKSSNRSDN